MAASAYEYPESGNVVQVVEAAADLIRQRGESAFAEFEQKDSRWREGEAYVFVLDPEGNMLVHPDAALKGKNQSGLKDINGKPIIRGLIEAATALPDRPEGWYHYQWPVPGGLLPRWKSSFVQRVKAPSGRTYVVGSGVYNDRMERAFVIDAVVRAVSEIERCGRTAFAAFCDPTGPYLAKDAYIWVNDMDGVELVNPAFRSLEGRSLLDMQDANGKYVYREMIRLIQTQGDGWVDYVWPKPGESVPSQKSAYVHGAQLGDRVVLVGCGVYLDDAPRAILQAPKMTAEEVIALVRDAAKLLEGEGAKAYPAFRQPGSRWFHGDTYLFAFDLDGNRTFYPVAPEEEGRNVRDLKDTLGRPILTMILDAVASPTGEGWVHYVYAKPGEVYPAWKSSFVKRVTTPSGKDLVLGCGIYNMQMHKAFIEDLVNRAASLLHEQGEAAFSLLRDKTGPFAFMNTYVFVEDPDGTELMNAAMPYLEGKNLIEVTDLQGTAVVRDEIAAAMTDGTAWLEHYWYLPGSNRPARKQTFVRKVQHDGRTFIVGSGLYEEHGPSTGSQQPGVVKTSWQSLKEERLTDALSRQVIYGDKATLARLTLKAGAGIARHYHLNEEYCWVFAGALEYKLDERTIVVGAGEIIVVPSNVPHAIVALEDSTCIDFFAPVREDWLKGEDQYLRKLH
jgi:signal transduction histidine kinase/quercetin dioxygenase-like cupin family protein